MPKSFSINVAMAIEAANNRIYKPPALVLKKGLIYVFRDDKKLFIGFKYFEVEAIRFFIKTIRLVILFEAFCNNDFYKL